VRFTAALPGARKRVAMLVSVNSVRKGPNPCIIICCIRACVWATIEGRPFCVLKFW
jgi:hypothetical protein